LIGKDLDLSFFDLKKLGMEKFKTDFHCCTGWSTLDLEFTGIPITQFLSFINPLPQWKFLYQISADGYTTVLFRDDVEKDGGFLCLGDSDGNLLSVEHGGIRLIFPHLFGWKSAKFLSELIFLEDYCEGFLGKSWW